MGLSDCWKDSPGPAGNPAPIPPPAPLYDVSQGGYKSGDPQPSSGANKSETLLGDFRSHGSPYFRGRGGEFCAGTRKCKMGSVRPGAD